MAKAQAVTRASAILCVSAATFAALSTMYPVTVDRLMAQSASSVASQSSRLLGVAWNGVRTDIFNATHAESEHVVRMLCRHVAAVRSRRRSARADSKDDDGGLGDDDWTSCAQATHTAHLGGTPPYLLVVGARLGYKQAPRLYAALHLLQRQQTDTKLQHAQRIPHVLLLGGARVDTDERKLLNGLAWTHLSNSADEAPDDVLVAAFTNAIALSYLSNAEGFGLPVAEALSCGCTVLVSSAPSAAAVWEVAGERPSTHSNAADTGTHSVLFVDPTNAHEVAAAIGTLMSRDNRTRIAARAHARKRASRFHGWDHMARAMSQMVEALTRTRTSTSTMHGHITPQ